MRKDFEQKNKTLTKREHLFKDYTSNYNADVLNCFLNYDLKILNLQLKIN